MKILMVSMPSLHFFRWTQQLSDMGHEVYWFDVLDGGHKVEKIDWVDQIVGWKLRWKFPFRYQLKDKLPTLYRFVGWFNERSTEKVFSQLVDEIQPDIVHSFALYVSCTPIYEVMKKHDHIKWVYSSWGSDLFYFQHKQSYLNDIQKVLPRVDYMFSDCFRDYPIAQKYGFKGGFLGVYPGGGGFHLSQLEKYKIPFEQRKTILLKGFQGRSGRSIPVLKALKQVSEHISEYNIVVFGTDPEVENYIKKSGLFHLDNFKFFGKIPHEDVLHLMGRSLLYIGNSNSDGMPNTLLESICMGVFPIQSNPGGVTEEVIQNNKNGFLIHDCENIEEISSLIIRSLSDKQFLKQAIAYNTIHIQPRLDYTFVKDKVVSIYNTLLG